MQGEMYFKSRQKSLSLSSLFLFLPLPSFSFSSLTQKQMSAALERANVARFLRRLRPGCNDRCRRRRRGEVLDALQKDKTDLQALTS